MLQSARRVGCLATLPAERQCVAFLIASQSSRSASNLSYREQERTPRRKVEAGLDDMEGTGANDLKAPSPPQNIGLLHDIRLGVGTWAWGDKSLWGYDGEQSAAAAEEAFKKSIEKGVCLLDTASIYGKGESERLLGRFLKNVDPVKRRKLVVATKYVPLPWHVNCRKKLMTSLKDSLERLGEEKVDLMQIHGPALSIRSIEHLVDGLADAYEAGLCKAVGVSNFSKDQVQQAHAALSRRNIPLSSNQVEFSLLRKLPETIGLLSTCKELGVSVLAYSPLAMGRLTGKYSAANPPSSGRKFGDFPMQEIEPLLEKMKEIGVAHGKTQAQVALNWIICKGAIPIPGAKNAKQAEDNAGALGWELTTQEVEQLSELGKTGKTSLFWQHG